MNTSTIESTAFLFSGQGSQCPGMGDVKDMLEKFPQLCDIYTAASDILGFDLQQLCLEGKAEELSPTAISQPAIMATSIVFYQAELLEGRKGTAVAGHSLGEYAAMVASNMVSLTDGFKLIKARAHAMGKAAEMSPGSMCAIIGKKPSTIEEVCGKVKGYVIPVNYNTPSQTVIAGDVDAIERAIAAFVKIGARAIKLNVSAAFHSKLMQPAADEFYQTIKDTAFAHPTMKFFSNITGDELTDFSDIPKMLAVHITSPVRFTKELEKMSELGYNNFIECGPSRTLTGFVKKCKV